MHIRDYENYLYDTFFNYSFSKVNIILDSNYTVLNVYKTVVSFIYIIHASLALKFKWPKFRPQSPFMCLGIIPIIKNNYFS
jgi:hypothetical protein